MSFLNREANNVNIVEIYKVQCLFSSDIEIAMSQIPKDIDLMASEIGLMPSEIDLYGKKKAKVSLKILDRMKDAPNGKYILCAG